MPSSPEALIELINKKQQKLEKAKEKAKELKQFYEVKEKNPVVMEIGKKGFYKIERELKNTEKYDYTIKYTSEFRPEWARETESNLKKGRDIRSLTRYDKETENDVKKWLKINKHIKKIENEGTAMAIIDDEEVMLSLIKSNVTLLIKDAAFCKIMKKLFLETYKNAEEIK